MVKQREKLSGIIKAGCITEFVQIMSNIPFSPKIFVIVPFSTFVTLNLTPVTPIPGHFFFLSSLVFPFSSPLCLNGCLPAVPKLWYKGTSEQVSAVTQSGDQLTKYLPFSG